MIDPHHGWNVSLKPPCIGFALSIFLLLALYAASCCMATIFILASVQALVQLVFFLHLGVESKPHWNTITFLFVVTVIAIIVGGSLWIMNNLEYNLMPNMRM